MNITQEQIVQEIQNAKAVVAAGQEIVPAVQENQLAGIIDHTVLKANAVKADILKVCREAKEYKFCAVCVNSCYVPLVAKELQGTGVNVASVVGFPLGAMVTAAKAYEAKEAAQAGAHEIDMVINVGALKDGDYQVVLNDIYEVVQASAPAIVKVIIETCLLTDDEKIAACVLSKMAGAHFVKTSTGFSTGGATPEDVRLMRRVVGPEIGVKASGGVRNREDAINVVNAGANRIGASSGIAIVTGDTAQSSKSY